MADEVEFFEQLKERIAEGDERAALEALRQFTRERAPKLCNEVLQQMGRLSQLEREERSGELTREEARVERGRLRKALLSLVDAVERSLRNSPVPPPVSAVKFAAPEEAHLEKIIGANNLKSIAWLRRGLEVSRSVCRVVTPNSVGSGFLLSGGRLLTNHHVIPSAEVAGRSYVEFNVEEEMDGRLTTPSRATINSEGLLAAADLDYCLVALNEMDGGAPLSSWGFLEIETKEVPKVGHHVTIVQHPAGGPKQIAITANQVVNVYEHRLQYTTDTMPGSSGSPVFNDAWKVVALHHSGGNVIINAAGDRMFANEGILMKHLRERLSL